GNTFRQPRWQDVNGDLEIVADPVCLALRRDGYIGTVVVEDNDFLLSTEPSGTDNGVAAPVYVYATANCPGIGSVNIRNNRFGWVDTSAGATPALVQIWSDSATTGAGFGSI